MASTYWQKQAHLWVRAGCHTQATSPHGLCSSRRRIVCCTLPRRLARVRMSFSISVYISSSEKRPMPWPYISRFTIPLVRWQRIHFSRSLRGPYTEIIFCVSWRFSTHWQYARVLEGCTKQVVRVVTLQQLPQRSGCFNTRCSLPRWRVSAPWKQTLVHLGVPKGFISQSWPTAQA